MHVSMKKLSAKNCATPGLARAKTRTEIVDASFETPEQILVGGSARFNNASIGEDNLDRTVSDSFKIFPRLTQHVPRS